MDLRTFMTKLNGIVVLVLILGWGTRLAGAETDFFVNPEHNSIVERGKELCIKWKVNKDLMADPYRGYFDFSLLNSNQSGTQYSLALGIDYSAGLGIKVHIPEGVPPGEYIILAIWNRCKYDKNIAYVSDPFLVVVQDVNHSQYLGLSPILDMVDNLDIGECSSEVYGKMKFFPQVNCETEEEDFLPVVGNLYRDNTCSITTKLDIRTLANGIIFIENVIVDDDCKLGKKHPAFNSRELERIRDSVYCLGNENCYPGEYCDNFNKAPEDNGYWRCRSFNSIGSI